MNPRERRVMVEHSIVIGILAVIVIGLCSYAVELDRRLDALERKPAAAVTLDSETTITVRTETPDGGEVLPPEDMKLWQYVEGRDDSLHSREFGLEAAIEMDLHRQDPRFHLTHEYIDGKEW